MRNHSDDPFFKSLGNKLEANNLEELYEIVAKLPVKSPLLKKHNHTNNREMFSLAIYLVKAAQYGFLDFPIRVDKREAPDFLLTVNGHEIGLEHRDIGSERAHRTTSQNFSGFPDLRLVRYRNLPFSPFGLRQSRSRRKKSLQRQRKTGKGRNTERRWVKQAYHGVLDKIRLLNKSHFAHYEQNDLVLYDCTLLRVYQMKRALKTLRGHLETSERYKKAEIHFDTVTIITNRTVYYDFLGEMLALPINPPGSCEI